VLVLHDDQPVNRVNAGAPEPIGLDLFDVGEQLRIGVGGGHGLARLIPAADRRSGPAYAGRAGEAGLDLTRRHHALQRFARTGMDHVRRQLQSRDMLLVIDDPRHLCRVEAVFVDEDAAGPNAGGHRIGADADLLAFEVLGHPDIGVRPHHEAAVMEAPHQEDRERRVGRAAGARDHVRCRRHFADVEFEVADHPPERGDDWANLNEIGVDALDRHLCGFHCAGVAVIGDRELQARLISHLLLLEIFVSRSGIVLRRLDAALSRGVQCLGISAFSITARHFAASLAIRSCISSGVLPCASSPRRSIRS
jgi:hypothetical protein